MDPSVLAEASQSWPSSVIGSNISICLNILGALLLGTIVGYERTWNGRAAGIRTYGFVCMASAALTVVVGHPALWYGGQAVAGAGGDPTRIIQGIVTGIGFLGAGMIMREGFSITGLTTAASIWTVAVIGVVVGIGFFPAAIALTLLATIGMLILQRIELILPSHRELAVRVDFAKGMAPPDAELRRFVTRHGYKVVDASLSIAIEAGAIRWHFMMFTRDRKAAGAERFARELAALPGVEALDISHARN